MQTNSGRAVLVFFLLKTDPLDYKQEIVGAARTNFSLLLLLLLLLLFVVVVVVVVVVHCSKQEEASFLTAAWIHHRLMDAFNHSMD